MMCGGGSCMIYGICSVGGGCWLLDGVWWWWCCMLWYGVGMLYRLWCGTGAYFVVIWYGGGLLYCLWCSGVGGMW